MKKAGIIAVIIVAVAVGVVVLMNNLNSSKSRSNQLNKNLRTTNATSASGSQEPIQNSQSPAASQTIQSTQTQSKNIVEYNGSGFSPDSITINNGDTVTFKNSSSTDAWVASDPHPTHTGYPGFDSKQTVPPGQTYSFTFTKTGTWGYHNHLSPGQKGTIIVK